MKLDQQEQDTIFYFVLLGIIGISFTLIGMLPPQR